jgi:hypothetical protein
LEGSGVQILDRGPLSPRANAAVAWTGTSLFVWGGNSPKVDLGRQMNDGATYDPNSGHWRMLSASPFPASYDPPVAVATPDEVIVAQGRVVASWHEKTNTWTRLDDAPAPVTDLAWAAGPLLSASANAALDPRTGRWTSLGARPPGLEDPQATWTGTELIAFGQGGEGPPPAAAYSPDTGRWKTLPPPSNLVGNAVGGTYDGQEVIVIDFDMHAAAYSPELNRWRALPDVPAAFYEWYPEVQATGSTVSAFMGNAVVIRSAADATWIPVPYRTIGIGGGTPHSAPGVAGDGHADELLLFGSALDGEANALVRLQPDRIRSNPSRVPLRSASVRLGDGYRYLQGDVIRTASGSGIGVSATIEGPSGRCVVGSTEEARAGRPSNGPWLRSGDQGWRRELRGQEVLGVKCANPAAADSIRERIEVPAQ